VADLCARRCTEIGGRSTRTAADSKAESDGAGGEAPSRSRAKSPRFHSTLFRPFGQMQRGAPLGRASSTRCRARHARLGSWVAAP